MPLKGSNEKGLCTAVTGGESKRGSLRTILCFGNGAKLVGRSSHGIRRMRTRKRLRTPAGKRRNVSIRRTVSACGRVEEHGERTGGTRTRLPPPSSSRTVLHLPSKDEKFHSSAADARSSPFWTDGDGRADSANAMVAPEVVTITGRGKKIKGASLIAGIKTTFTHGKCGALLVSLSKRTGLASDCLGSFRNGTVKTTIGDRRPLTVIPLESRLSLTPNSVRAALLRGVPTERVREALRTTLPPCSVILVSAPPDVKTLAVYTFSVTSRMIVPLATRLSSFGNVGSVGELMSRVTTTTGAELRVLKTILSVCSRQLGLSRVVARKVRTSCGNVLFRAAVEHGMTVTRTKLGEASVFSCSPRDGKTTSCATLARRVVRQLRL